MIARQLSSEPFHFSVDRVKRHKGVKRMGAGIDDAGCVLADFSGAAHLCNRASGVFAFCRQVVLVGHAIEVRQQTAAESRIRANVIEQLVQVVSGAGG